jgi:hypothetical protein
MIIHPILLLIGFGVLLGCILFAKYVNTSLAPTAGDPLILKCNPIIQTLEGGLKPYSSLTCTLSEINAQLLVLNSLTADEQQHYYTKTEIVTVNGHEFTYYTALSLEGTSFSNMASIPPWTLSSTKFTDSIPEEDQTVTRTVIYSSTEIGTPPESGQNTVDEGDGVLVPT